MLRACYPAEVGSGSYLWADRSISTSQVEFGLAQREAEVVSKLYARLNTHVSDAATSDTAGAAVSQSAALHVQRRSSKTNYTVLGYVACGRRSLEVLVGSLCRQSRFQRPLCC